MAGGLLAINYVSGEHMTGFTEGRPLVARGEGASLTLENLMRLLGGELAHDAAEAGLRELADGNPHRGIAEI